MVVFAVKRLKQQIKLASGFPAEISLLTQRADGCRDIANRHFHP